MHEELLIGLAGIIGLGIAAQWLAWRLNFPSILLLLLFGFVAGPITHFLHVDELFGDLLFPIVSVSVAIILFEGGLTLRFGDLQSIGGLLPRLLTVGVGITWLLTALAAHFIVGLELTLSLLLGAILVVTGPTVVIPLLKQIRPTGRVATILRWEGIVIDPVGAVLAVLVFEVIRAADINAGVVQAIVSLLITIVIGLVIGYVTARVMIELFGRNWVPENLQNPVSLMFLVAAFTLSNMLQAESGLLTVTVMGIVMANQDLNLHLGGRFKWSLAGKYRANVSHIIEFKENLQVLLISSLFIILAARLRLEDFAQMGLADIIFVAILILIVRPIAVWASAFGSLLSWKEKLFVAWMAPRGIVAASVASVFAFELAQHGNPGAELLVPVVFSVIAGTVIIYGLTAGPLAIYLGVAQANPQGVLIIGAQSWARRIGLAVQSAGYRVLLVDTNWSNIRAARMEGLNVFYGSILAQYTNDHINLNGIGRMLALTSNDEVNALATLQFAKTFGRMETYQLPPHTNGESRKQTVSDSLSGRFLFGANATYDYLKKRCQQGATIKTTSLTSEFDVKDFREIHGENAILLFVIDEAGDLQIYTAENPPKLTDGSTVISLVDLPPDQSSLADEYPIRIEVE